MWVQGMIQAVPYLTNTGESFITQIALNLDSMVLSPGDLVVSEVLNRQVTVCMLPLPRLIHGSERMAVSLKWCNVRLIGKRKYAWLPSPQVDSVNAARWAIVGVHATREEANQLPCFYLAL